MMEFINPKKYQRTSSQNTPIIRYIKVPEYETRFGCGLSAFLGPLNSNGVLYNPSGGDNGVDCNFAGVKTVSQMALYCRFYYCGVIKDVDFPDLQVVNMDGFYCAFRYSGIRRFNAPKLSNINIRGLYYAFGDSYIETADLSGLETISSEYALGCAFNYCSYVENVDLSNLTMVTGSYALYACFEYTKKITTMVFPKLKKISGIYTCGRLFANSKIQDIKFPAVVSSGLPQSNVFFNMLSRVTGCTVHFPSNLQSVIGSWSEVLSGFGGTNTTVLFDLPATE